MNKLPMIGALFSSNRKAAPAKDACQDTATTTATDSYATWNSWGERNPFSMGSSGRF